MPEPKDVRFFASPAKLRAWLEANHEKASEIWVGFYRKASGRPSITWQQLVDEELCFGWIDSVRYGLDTDSFAQRITPRKARSTWSAINIRRAKELTELGLMRPRGQAAFDARDEKRSAIYSYENRHRGLDAPYQAEFRKHKQAWEFFQSLPPSYRNTAGYWVSSAKLPETRARRLASLIEHSGRRERIPPLAPRPR
jgi:uncharacterized protein YdeI (YjbR/CyaY-like superfamily)